MSFTKVVRCYNGQKDLYLDQETIRYTPCAVIYESKTWTLSTIYAMELHWLS